MSASVSRANGGRFSPAWIQNDSGLSPRPGRALCGTLRVLRTVRASRRRRAYSVVRHNAGSAMFGIRRREFVTLLGGAIGIELPTSLLLCPDEVIE